jgi:hypothetical protein
LLQRTVTKNMGAILLRQLSMLLILTVTYSLGAMAEVPE